MRTIFLSLLLVLLLFVGILAKPRLEQFTNSAKPEPVDVKKIMMSPSFSQMITTPTITSDVKKPGIDALSRDAVVQKATGTGSSSGTPLYDVLAVPHGSTDNFKYYPETDEEEKKYLKQCMNNYKKKDQEQKCPKCPKCPEGPDMSKYVKLDEVPCWNCSLP
jgi:hypothetical protein